MNTEDVIKKVVDLNFGYEELDMARILRIEKLAMDNGKDGRTALDLLTTVKRLLGITNKVEWE